jgi:ABC-type nitrate/sulfonate/bicarbonate transport system substrate-binding protein
MCRTLLLFTVLIALGPSFAKSIAAQERFRIAWAGMTPSNTPIWVAEQKGLFQKKWPSSRGHSHQREYDRDPSLADR